MARRLIKSAIAAALHYTGAGRLVGDPAAQTAPLILGYHRVVEDFDASARHSIPAMLVSTATLERHIDLLARRFEFISLDDAAARHESGEHGKPAAVLTFDDGYRDVYENAFPMLQRKGIPCAVFVVTDLAGTDDLLLHDELYLLVTRCFGLWTTPRREIERLLHSCGLPEERAAAASAASRCPYSTTRALLTRLATPEVRAVIQRLREAARIPAGETHGMGMMDWEMIAAMRRAGHVVGSHTRSHAYLTNESHEAVEDELRGSRYELQRRLGEEVEHLAYPNGDFNAAVAGAAEAAGFRYAYTVCGCRDPRMPRYTIPRRMVWERSGFGIGDRFSPAVFSCETRGVFDRLTGCTRAHYA